MSMVRLGPDVVDEINDCINLHNSDEGHARKSLGSASSAAAAAAGGWFSGSVHLLASYWPGFVQVFESVRSAGGSAPTLAEFFAWGNYVVNGGVAWSPPGPAVAPVVPTAK